MTRHQNSGGKKKDNAPKKPSLTHFLCIPLITSASRPQLEASIGKFKDEVCSAASVGALKGESVAVEEAKTHTQPSPATQEEMDIKSVSTSAESSGKTEEAASLVQVPLIAEKAIRPLDSLHLTLGVMSLDGDKLTQATDLLKNLDLEALLREATTRKDVEEVQEKTEVSDKSESQPPAPLSLENPLRISLTSLQPMQSPHKTSILYISPSDPSERLKPLCLALRQRFSDAELLVPDTRPLRLHATIVNTIYAKGRRKPKPKSRTKKGEDDKKVDAETAKDAAVESTSATRNAPKDESDHGEQSSPIDGQKDGSKQLTANDAGSGHGPDAKAPLRFDAREILERYKDHVWAEDFCIDRVAICEMGAKKVLDEAGKIVREEYKEIAVKRLPVS